MPPKAQRCGNCNMCKVKCQQESCYLCLPCEKQVANNMHDASESDNATDLTSNAMEVVGNIVSNFNQFNLDDITMSVSAGVSSTPIGGCSEVNSLDHRLTENLNETEVLSSQNLKAAHPYNQSTWKFENFQVPDPNLSQSKSNFVRQDMPIGSCSASNNVNAQFKPVGICPDKPVFGAVDPCPSTAAGRCDIRQAKDQTVQTFGLAAQILPNQVTTSTTATNTVTTCTKAINSISETLASSTNYQERSLDNSIDMTDSDFEFHLSLDELPRKLPDQDESKYKSASHFDSEATNVSILGRTGTVFSEVMEFPKTHKNSNEVQIGSVLNSSSIVQNVPISTSCDLNKAKPNIQEESYRQTKPSRTRSDKPILGAGNFRSTFAIGQSVSRQSRKQAPKSGLVKQFLPESAITSSLTASDNEYQTFHTQQIDLENRSENNCVLSFDDSDGSETTFFPTTCVDDNMSPTTIPKTFLKQLISNINGLNSSEGSTVAPIGATSIPSTEQILSEGSTAAPVGAISIPSTKINLQKCKESGKIRAYSTCEVERAAIDDSTFIGYEEKTATVKSPFLDDPVKWGTIDNYKQADLALLAQLRKVEAEKCSMCSLMDLPKELQNRTRIVPARDYLTWQPTWNASSITTPCRLVVDPSMSVNTLQQLLELNLSFKGWLPVEAFDISKMYNQLFLHPEHYQPQLMLFMRVGIGCHPNNF